MQIEDRLIGVNYTPGRAGQAVKATVIHIMEGTLAGTTSHFRNPASKVSSHYAVGRDGQIVRFVREQDTAWTNGNVQKPDRSIPLIDYWVRQGINPNRATVTIELEGYTRDDPTPEQLQSTARLVADIHRRHGLAINSNTVLGHYEIDSVDRPNCPGLTTTQWYALLDAARRERGLLSQTAGYFPQTGHWLHPDFIDAFSKAGGVPEWGYPLEGAVLDDDGVIRQLMENVLLERYPDGTVRLGGLGQRYAALKAKVS